MYARAPTPAHVHAHAHPWCYMYAGEGCAYYLSGDQTICCDEGKCSGLGKCACFDGAYIQHPVWGGACRKKKTACPPGQRFTAGNNADTTKDDTTCTACADGEYKDSATTCAAKRTSCGDGQYLTTGSNSEKTNDDTTCTVCKACPSSQVKSGGCAGASDTACSNPPTTSATPTSARPPGMYTFAGQGPCADSRNKEPPHYYTFSPFAPNEAHSKCEAMCTSFRKLVSTACTAFSYGAQGQ